MTPTSPAAGAPDPAQHPLAAFLLARVEDAYQAAVAAGDARAEAEADARRALITLHSERPHGSHECPGWMWRDPDFPDAAWETETDYARNCTTLRLLALPDADHADYRAEWTIEGPHA